jgi:hypothetical protein
MPLGKGKYQHLVETVMRDTEAATALVIVLRGNLGSGAAYQQCESDPVEALKQTKDIVAVLRDMADHLERDAMAIATAGTN